MGEPRTRRPRAQRRAKRILLVGLTPLLQDVLYESLTEAGNVHGVPFPGDEFEAAADGFAADLVIVDVTYLDEALVRPLMMRRFASPAPVLVFVSEQGSAWFDDLRHGVSGPIERVDAKRLIDLVSGPNLTLVER